ncbi:OmpA family protein [Thiohalomonas denitrificans]|uniref:OmpA family protein n=1 Tax=Thiohalomonas denitrificans TaxID=415747 RepID=A0A1G5QTV0_9GAMM|nr:OmpA family protein [Thiohalomonas denitrificans]SCZ64651.1 OmpA family protein [Thiohalomonas denitrificans]
MKLGHRQTERDQYYRIRNTRSGRGAGHCGRTIPVVAPFWSRIGHGATRAAVLCICLLAAAAPARGDTTADTPVQDAGRVESGVVGEATERHLSTDEVFRPWIQDPDQYAQEQGDKIEVRKVLDKEAETRKLQGVIPPIRFASGEADIPDSYIDLVRKTLAEMKHRINVRLHFVGHSDNVPLRGALQQQYGDNLGLSRERAGTTAEYFQRALDLPAESISYEGLGETRPVASNDTAEGRAQNRRVEVEVWYDEVSEKLVEKEVVVSDEIKRVKMCRVETVCKLSYKEGNAKRTRIKNLLPPLRYDEDASAIPARYLQQIREALQNLRGKQNVLVKFIGYTDNIPLTGRPARIYGNHGGLSKARARRVALAVQDALGLPTSAVDSDGKGAALPVASNETPRGRALNRRVEVEFWHDDPLAELPDEPQLCPEAAAAETVTRVYDPPTGAIKPIYFENGRPQVPTGYIARLGRVLDEVRDKTNPRLRFIGYTNNERLDRRTAMVYGDDVGLSAARATKLMERAKEQLELEDAGAESEGRGYVQSEDVVNSGFVEAELARVEVQVVYDELASMDDADLMEIQRLTREVTPKNPFALNLMRITVDGKPVSDPNKSIPDVQRCTDVALDQADIQFKFDNLDLKPRLNITAWPSAVRYKNLGDTEFPENRVRFRRYSNYPDFIARSEVRIFDAEDSTRAEPIAVVPVSEEGFAEWHASFDRIEATGRELKYLLRVYDEEGHFDETESQALWIIDELQEELEGRDADRELLVGYGENRLGQQNIPLQGGAIKVLGTGIPEGHSVWLAGRPLPVSEDGEFVAEEILPSGMHTVEVAILDQAGNGELFLRDLELRKSDWFYVGIADLTIAADDTNGPAELVTGDETHYDNDVSVDGRLAFYTKGKFGDGWRLTASADTREGPVEDLFSNFMDKSPDALFRRIDPDYYYPTFGDDSTVEEDAPTSGKLYARLARNQNYGLWGNFKIGYLGNSLAHVDRSLYGANLHYQTLNATSFGEERLMLDGFVAEPGTIASRDEFRGTGGSLYSLRHRDILTGSERVRIEIRDKDSGIVTAVKNLSPGLDYDIDYLQGRVLLAEPLSATTSDDMLVDSGTGGGDQVYLVARYEYTPGFDEVDTLVAGGRAHYWFNDYVKLGVTSNQNDEDDAESSLNALDLTLRKSTDSWVRIEASESEGGDVTTLFSGDGGFNFDSISELEGQDPSGGAYRVDASLGLRDVFADLEGKLTLHRQSLEAGYASPGLTAATDTDQYGGSLEMPVTERVGVRAKADKKSKQLGLETSAVEVDVDYLLNDHWTLSGGIRHDKRTDRSPVVPLTQEQGERADAVVQADYDSREKWNAYGFVQDTVNTTGNRDENGRVGTGGAYRVSDRIRVRGEVSGGDLGAAGKLGTDYLYTDRTNLYLTYALENERTDNGVRARRGNLTSGFKTRYSDSASLYAEESYSHGDVPTGLMHSTGVDLAPNDRWNFGANLDIGTLKDPETSAETRREAIGVRVGYGFDRFTVASALEYRVDETENPDTDFDKRTTWLTKNSLKYQTTPDWRFIGKLNHSESESSLGEFYDGNYTEAVLGYAYRPVNHDRMNALFKYTYFYNLPSTDQVSLESTASDYVQKSHIVSGDLLYDITRHWSLGGKYAYRLGQISQERESPEFFDSNAHLYVLRADWHFVRKWDALMEWRVLDLPEAQDRRDGALVAVYRHVGDHVKLGVGYNFTDFSDDLTDLDYDSQGAFLNIIGKF